MDGNPIYVAPFIGLGVALRAPTADGSANQVIKTDGSGNLSFVTVASGITIDSTAITSGAATRILFENASNQVSSSANFTYDASGNVAIGAGTLSVSGAGAAEIPLSLELAAAQSANAFEINSSGGSAGDVAYFSGTSTQSLLQLSAPASNRASRLTLGSGNQAYITYGTNADGNNWLTGVISTTNRNYRIYDDVANRYALTIERNGTNIYFGDSEGHATPRSFLVNGEPGSGTDIAGADITIGTGAGTGDGLPGSVLIKSAPADVGAGATLNDLSSTVIEVSANATVGTLGFYGATPVAQQTGVAVSAAAIHAALVSLGLITA